MSIANKCEQGDDVSNRLADATAKNLISIAGVLELADKQASDTCVFNMRVQVPSPAPKKSYHIDTTFFIQVADLVYHPFLRAYLAKTSISSALWAVYHHAPACI